MKDLERDLRHLRVIKIPLGGACKCYHTYSLGRYINEIQDSMHRGGGKLGRMYRGYPADLNLLQPLFSPINFQE